MWGSRGGKTGAEDKYGGEAEGDSAGVDRRGTGVKKTGRQGRETRTGEVGGGTHVGKEKGHEPRASEAMTYLRTNEKQCLFPKTRPLARKSS